MQSRTEISVPEACLFVAICFGWAIVGSSIDLFSGFPGRQFSDDRFESIIVTEFVFGGVALFLLGRLEYDVSGLFPDLTFLGAALGVALYFAAIFTGGVLGAMAATAAVANPLDGMVKSSHPSLAMALAIAMVNGPYEEIFLMGLLLRGLRRHGAWIAIGAPLLVRVLYHTYQGPVGAVSVFGFGLVVSAFYFRTGRLFPVVFAHVLADFIPLAALAVAGS